MIPSRIVLRRVIGATMVVCILAPSARAGAHTWRITEVFSNADGTIQFVELRESFGGAGEIFLGGLPLTSNSTVFNFSNNLTPPTSNKYLLVATPAFAALPGAPTPDFTLPTNFLSTLGDTVRYHVYDTWTFGAIPTDGVNSLSRSTGVGPNSPTNYAGQTGSVNASPCATTLCGDSNCDGQVNVLDINAFILAIGGRAAWEAQFSCNFCCANDINHDNDVNVLDINGFVSALSSGSCSAGQPCAP